MMMMMGQKHLMISITKNPLKILSSEFNMIRVCDASSPYRQTYRALVKRSAASTYKNTCTVEPLYNEVLGTMKITLLYQVSHYIRVKKQRNIKNWDQQNYLVIRGFCYIRPLYNEVPL